MLRRLFSLVHLLRIATDPFLLLQLGIGATVAFYVSSAAKETGFGSLLTIGFAYGAGICLAITCAGQASGGHLSPW